MFRIRHLCLLLIITLMAALIAGCGGGGGSTTTGSLVTTSSVARNSILPAATAGSFSVGSSNIEFDPALMAPGLVAHDYLGGNDIGGTRYYLDSILINSADVFQFNVSVPNDPTLYGSDANTTIPYVGYLLYPTSTPSPYPDYLLGTTTLPGMQGAGQPPLLESNTTLYPLIIYSHGRGAQPLTQQQIDLAQLLASHGYIVCMLFHGDNRFPAFNTNNMNQAQDIALRPLTVKTAIDQLANPATTFGALFASHIDFTRIGGVGESYGGTTMAALQGARIIGPTLTTTRPLVQDTRIIASANIVPFLGKASGDLLGLNHSGIRFISAATPYMAVTGTLDNLTSQSDYKSALGSIMSSRYLISISNEGHAFSASAYSDAYAWILEFLNAYVKQDPVSHSALEHASSVAGGALDSVL